MKNNHGNIAGQPARKAAAPQGADQEKPVERVSFHGGREKTADARDDLIDIASMDSFPCSDPPGYYQVHC